MFWTMATMAKQHHEAFPRPLLGRQLDLYIPTPVWPAESTQTPPGPPTFGEHPDTSPKNVPMHPFIHHGLFSLLLLSAGSLSAQTSYFLHVDGQVANCAGNSMVTVQVMPDNGSSLSVTIPIMPGCYFQHIFSLPSASGTVFAYATCGSGTLAGDSTSYTIPAPGDTAHVELGPSCAGSDAEPQACITVSQSMGGNGPVPFSAVFQDCTTGGVPPYTNMWLLPNGSINAEHSPSFTFGGPGAYLVCLQSSDAIGQASVTCDTVVVDTDGIIDPASSPDCAAGFLAVQAYTDTSNGNGMVAPIPDLVWVVNTSIVPSDEVAVTWDFGDGGTSTEAFPSHTYSGPGPWLLCLTLSGTGCSDTYCRTLSMDEDGMLQGMAPGGHPTAQPSDARANGFTVNVVPVVAMGITETGSTQELKLWPNPVSEMLNISFAWRHSGQVQVDILDAAGRAVMAERITASPGTNVARLRTGGLEPGLYMVRIGHDAPPGRFMKTH